MRQHSRTWGGIGLWCVIVACGCQEKKPAPPPANNVPGVPAVVAKPVSAEDAVELHRLRIQALGHLENQEFAQCETALQTIAAKLPADLFVLQNRAICRQLAVEGIDAARNPAEATAAVSAANEAIAAYENAAATDPIPRWLKARLEIKLQNRTGAIAALQQATQMEPDFVPAWYELYQLLRESNDPALYTDPNSRKELLTAGMQVARLAPDNWFFWKDWAYDLAKTGDAEFKPLMEHMRTALEPFAATYQRDVRANPVTLIDNALKAWDSGPKDRALPQVMILRNILVSEAAVDKDALSRHALDFVRTEFSTTLPVSVTEATAAPLKLTFTPQTVPLDGVNLDDVQAIRSLDADIDGKADLVVLTTRRLQVFSQNEGKWTANFGVDLPGDAKAFVAADLDDDADPVPSTTTGKIIPPADPEFIVSGPGGLWVFENQPQKDGPRTLVLRDKDAPWTGATDVTAVVLLDIDGDGDLDLFAGGPTPRWFIYRGNFLFGEVTERSQLPPADFRTTAAVAVDWDRDVDTDLLVSSAQGVALFENIRHGRFRYRDLGAPWQPFAGAKVLNLAELNGDTAWDVVATGPQGTYVAMTDPSPAGRLSPSIQQLSDRPGDWLLVADFDNDGAVDIASDGMKHPPQTQGSLGPSNAGLYLNDGKAQFHASSLLGLGYILTAACTGDIDHDGDVDVAFVTPANGLNYSSYLLTNNNGNQNHWIELRPRGIQEKGNGPSNSKRVNHQAIGSLVELRVGDRYQAGIVEGQSIRFGLGSATRPDAIRIVWTNGVPHAILEPKVDMVLTEEMLPIGSCPYVYVWNGERFEFFTDLLWNAPLGLKHAEDIVAGWREWEYLKIDGDRMRPRGDEYVLQVTEELWEIAYFDQLKLIAIDHPADVQVFTNEKVGPPDIAQPKIHTVKSPRLPIAARDPQGRDILHEVKERDGHFTRTYDRKIASGLTPEHYLELDFGDLGDAKQITLFLTGWMYPTDTSINVQFSQDPTMTRPRPPALWAVDATGEWREVQPFMGFPGGKTKTIAIDVTDALTPGDARLRIVTNMEFYWDHAFLSVDETPVAVREQELSLKHADLHFRGCSQAVYRPHNGPEFYDYDHAVTQPQWPPLGGHFTRYGDITPLLRERDDHLAVFGAGDEMTITFALPQERLPDGWVRDFVMYNVGWDKDAALNTVHGMIVEPLPYRAMKVYGNGEERPRDVAYEEYLRTYQTRRQPPKAFWNQLQHGRALQPRSTRTD